MTDTRCNKEVYDNITKVLNRFISVIRDCGNGHGMTYSFSPRKIQIDYLAESMGIMIRNDAIFLIMKGYTEGKLLRPKSESVAFQISCTSEYCCDKAMEDLIVGAIDSHHNLIRTKIDAGVWEV